MVHFLSKEEFMRQASSTTDGAYIMLSNEGAADLKIIPLDEMYYALTECLIDSAEPSIRQSIYTRSEDEHNTPRCYLHINAGIDMLRDEYKVLHKIYGNMMDVIAVITNARRN